MNITRIKKNRGFQYACDNQLYNRYATKNGVIYVKCHVTGCKGAGKILPEHELLEVCLNFVLHLHVYYYVKFQKHV